jgi:hypothetical protein
MELTFKQAGKLQDVKRELLDLGRVLDIEIANTDDVVAKSNMLETKLKTLVAIVNIEKQVNNTYIKQRI